MRGHTIPALAGSGPAASEDYLFIPKIIGRAVEVSALATIVAVLVGDVLLGIIPALVAIPIAAAIQLVLREVFLPRLDT